MNDPNPALLRSFSQTLANLAAGALNDRLTEDQHELLEAMAEAGGLNGGKATGTLSITIHYKLDGGTVDITTETKTKAPKPAPVGRSTFWLTPEGNLSMANPRQRDFESRDVAMPRTAPNLA